MLCKPGTTEVNTETTTEVNTETTTEVNTETTNAEDTRRRRSTAECNTEFESEEALEELETKKVEMLLLPSSARLRFKAADPTAAWTTLQAMSSARLVFTAWDGSAGQAFNRTERKLPYCCSCSGSSSLARDFTLFYIEKSDCTGQPVLSVPKEFDDCNVCGGDGTSCRDCNNVLNGGGVSDCGVCHSSLTEAKAGRDCLGACGGNVIIRTNSSSSDNQQLCVPKGVADNMTMCDGAVLSGARINECGICVGGTTGLLEHSGLHKCGGCEASASKRVCDHCGEEKDDCGVCNKPNSDSWNACARKFGDLSLTTLDILQSTFLETSFSNQDINQDDYSNPKCSLIDKVDRHLFGTAEVRRGYLLLGLNKPPLGVYSVYCTLESGNLTVEMYSRDNSKLNILNSRNVQVLSANLTIADNRRREVTLRVERIPEDNNLDDITCFYRKKLGLEGGVMDGGMYIPGLDGAMAGGQVYCGSFLPLGGGKYQFGLTLTRNTKAVTNLLLSTAEGVIITQGPAPLSANFSSNLDTLVITFDKNIQGSLPCEQVFHENTTKLLQDSECMYKADMLTIVLSSQSRINFSDVLNFSRGNNIREFMSDADFSMEVSGSVIVQQPGDIQKMKPVFSLLGPTEICPAAEVRIEIGNTKRFRLENSSIKYKLTSTKSPDIDLSSLLKLVESGSGVIIQPDKLMFDLVYNLSARVESRFGIQSDPQSIEFVKPSSKKTISVLIRGPVNVQPDADLHLKAEMMVCNSTSTSSTNFRYYWSSDVPSLDLSKKNSPSIRVNKGSLQGGRTYNFSVLLISESEGMTGVGWSLVTTRRLGPLAATAADKLTFGTGNKVILDATLSVDRDNTGQDIKFEWTCKTVAGLGCYQKDTKRLEENLPEGTLKASYITLPEHSLVPDRYIMTVIATIDGMNSTASMEVVIAPGNPPTISPISMETRYNTQNRITVNALVSGSVGTCVQWSSVNQDGFVLLENLEKITRSAESQCFQRETSFREFPLEVPAPSDVFPGLQGGARYKFLVTASHPILGKAEAMVVIETLSPPVPGSLKVSPGEGQGMKTRFKLVAEDFTDQDTPLVYKFGVTEKERTRWMGRVLSGPPELERLLPASEQGLDLVLQVCDSYQACTTTGLDKPLKVEFQELNSQEIITLGEEGAQLAAEGACQEALTFLSQLIQTVEMSTAQSNSFKPILCQFYSDIFIQCAGKLMTEADCSSTEDGTNLVQDVLSSTCQLKFEAYSAGMDLSLKIRNLESKCKSASLSTSAMRVERIGFSFDSETGVDNGRDPDKLFSDRKKREALSNFVNSLVRTLTPQQIELFVDIAVRGLSALGFDGNSNTTISNNNDINQQTKDIIRQKLREFMEAVHDVYMAEMCKGSSSQSPPELVKTDDLSITVIKTELTSGPDEEYHFDSSQSSVYGSSTLVLKDTVYNDFSQWNCGKMSASGDELPCVGLCLGTAVLEQDFISPSSDSFSAKTPEIVSKIHDIRLLNPVNGEDLTTNIQRKEAVFKDPLSLQLNIGDANSRDGFTFRCGLFIADEWTDKFCETRGITPLGDGTAQVNCDCSLPGYVSVYLVENRSNKPLLEMLEHFPFNKQIQFRIEENYGDVVGEEKDAFMNNLKAQLATSIGTSPSNLQKFNIWPGSIEVSFNLVAPTELEAGQQAQAYEAFQQMLAEGKLDLNDLEGNPMYVPPQCIDSCAVEAVGEDIIPIVIAAVAMAIVLFILTFIICAVCMKKKKTEEKLKPFTPPSQQPTYRSFQFADSMEGTGNSLMRNRKVSGIPEYMPSNFNSRNQTSTSIQLTDEEGAAVRGKSADSWGVPYAANYTEPSQEMISLTQPIPEHILHHQRGELLPGTPGN